MKRIFRRTQDLMFLFAIVMAFRGLWALGAEFANRNKPYNY